MAAAGGLGEVGDDRHGRRDGQHAADHDVARAELDLLGIVERHEEARPHYRVVGMSDAS